MPGTRFDKKLLLLPSLLALGGLCSFQFGDNSGLNNMPFAQVEPLVSDPAKAQRMAKQGNIDLFIGHTVSGRPTQFHGEFTDANCYLTTHRHAYDHAFCAKFCIAAGAPLIFIPDQGGQVYIVLAARNGVRVPDNVLDHIGVPGTTVEGKVFDADGIHVLAVEGLGK
jgi:hypothetical protein